MTVKYFAYGSNMSPTVMSANCRRHRFLGVARLADHRLMFNRRSVRTGTGVADVVPAKGISVWGALYEVDEDDLSAIDRKEGYDWAYTRAPLAVQLYDQGSEHVALTYTVRRKEPTEVCPSPEYLDGLIDAARELGLPEGYLRFLERLRKRFFLEAH
jgi:gamma-glutamylcyclotransferase